MPNGECMEQIFLKVKLPSGKTCLITNTGVNYARVWEEDLITIGVTDPDIYTDTKRQLGAATATPPSRRQLESLGAIENLFGRTDRSRPRIPG